MAKFNIYDTVEVTSTVNNKLPKVRGVLVSYLHGFISDDESYFDGVYVLRKIGKTPYPVSLGHACKIMPCRIAMTEKTIVNKEKIDKLKLMVNYISRRDLVKIKILEHYIGLY